MPDPELMVPTKGRRRKKRFRSDMDDLAGYTGMKQFDSGHFMEPPDINNCGQCDDPGHNVRTCTKKSRTDANTSSIQMGVRRGGSGGTRGGRTGGRGGRTSLRGSARGGTTIGGRGGLASLRGAGGGGRASGLTRTRRIDRGRPIDVLLNPDG